MSFWTAERIVTLRALWQAGNSASEIADAIGDECTRNMVISKSRRIPGVDRRSSPIVRSKLAEKIDFINLMLYRRSTITGIARLLDCSPETVTRVAKDQGWTIKRGRNCGHVPPPDYRPPAKHAPRNEGGCEYIINDPRDGAEYCGAARVPSKPYCDAHLRRCVTRHNAVVMSPEEARIRSERAKANSKAVRANSFLFGG